MLEEAKQVKSNPTVLRQKKWPITWEFEVTDKGVSFREDLLINLKRYNVPFENIGRTPVRSLFANNILLIGGIVLFGLSALMVIGTILEQDVEEGASLFYLIFGVVCVIPYWISRKRVVVFPGEAQPLYILEGRPNQETVDAFVEAMFQKQTEYFRENYLPPVGHQSIADELTKLTWLHQHGAITTEELEKIKSDLIRGRDPSNTTGFSMN